MTLNQETILTVISPAVLDLIKKNSFSQFNVQNLKSFDMDYRLNKYSEEYFVLDSLCLLNMDDTGRMGLDFNRPNEVSTTFTFRKSHGLYKVKRGIFKTKVTVYIPKELESAYQSLSNIDNSLMDIQLFSKDQNNLISAFSRESLLQSHVCYRNMDRDIKARKLLLPDAYDRQYYANGFMMHMIMTYEGFPQAFIENDDEPIAAFHRITNGMECRPISNYKEKFDFLSSVNFFSAFK